MRSDAKTRDALLDMRDNILLARQFVRGLSFGAFQASRFHFYATVRAIEIISEAGRRLPDDLRAGHPNVPWRAIRDAGNVYRHAYDDIVENLIWATVQDELGPLLAVVETELSGRGD